MHKLEYLGYVITEIGVRIDSEKISIIIGWPTSRNILEVQLFLEFTNFYYRFIKEYSEIAVNLINLIKKD